MDSDTDSNQLWHRRYNELRRWHSLHGNCNVPKSEGRLGRWVVRQRELQKKGKLDKARKILLDESGFVWNTNEAAWQARYAILTAYVTSNGHCCVPISDPSLGMWVAKMRANRRKGKLLPHRIQLLDRLGFVWNTAEADWMNKYDKLIAFRDREGHVCVPFNEGELGWWVNTQRQSKRKGKLSDHRHRLLDQAGFIWNPQQFLAARRREAATVKARAAALATTTPITTSLPSAHPLNERKRSVSMDLFTEQRDIPYSSDQYQGHSKRLKVVPLSPRPQQPQHHLVHEPVQKTATGLPYVSSQGYEPSSVPKLYSQSRPLHHAFVPPIQLQNRNRSSTAESMTTSWTDRGDLQSVPSLLSPMPAVSHESASWAQALPARQQLHLSSAGGAASVSQVPSFHPGRSIMACVTASHRRPAPRDFVLPPISSLQAFHNHPEI